MARPEFKPTSAARRNVAIAAGGGMSHEEIALGLGISRNTLEKHFQGELSYGANRKRLEVLEAMFDSARKGNVAAQKAYMALTPKPAAPPLELEQPKGKKEQAHADAKTAQVGTEWETLLKGSVPLQ
jgi:hypothetical protein